MTEIINHVDRGRPVKKSYKMNGISMILISFGMCEDLFLILLFKKFGKRHPKSLNVKGYGIKKSIYSRNQIETKKIEIKCNLILNILIRHIFKLVKLMLMIPNMIKNGRYNLCKRLCISKSNNLS